VIATDTVEFNNVIEFKSEIVYKALRKDGKSTYQNWLWPLPTDTEPGEWVEVKPPAVLCQHGFHGYRDLEQAFAFNGDDDVYEMEISGDIHRDHEKVVATKARLLRKLDRNTAIIIEKGVRLCKDCGKVHDYLKRNRKYTWNDPSDGHEYNPESWEALLSRLSIDEILPTVRRLEHIAIEEERREIKPSRSPNGQYSYKPCIPSFHAGPFRSWDKFPDRCGTCGLDKGMHEGWEERAKLADEFGTYDRWELILYIQRMRK
jgi:hypothetical protein